MYIVGAHGACNLPRLVAACVAHIDLVELYCRELPEALQKRTRGVRRIRTRHGWTIRVTDTSPPFLEWLAEVQERSWRGPSIQRLYLYRSEVAAEIITEDQQKADRIHAFAARWFHLKWPGNNKITRYLETTYWGRRGSGRNLVAYSSQGSKVTGRPACRVELRLTGSAGRRIIATVEQLASVNPRQLFARCIKDGPLGLIGWIPEQLVPTEVTF